MRTPLWAGAVLLLAVAACGTSETEEKPVSEPAHDGHVLLDHILIGVRGPRLPQARMEPEARVLARSLFDRLRAGGDWAAAKREHSEDPPPGGPYELADHGVAPAPGAYPRARMAPAFGDVGFSLKVGETGLAEYDPAKSPFGFHVIKRVR